MLLQVNKSKGRRVVDWGDINEKSVVRKASLMDCRISTFSVETVNCVVVVDNDNLPTIPLSSTERERTEG